MTREDLKAKYPRASEAFLRLNSSCADGEVVDPRPPASPEPEPIICDAIETPVRAQEGNSGRYTVRIESRRCRLLDPDNLVGGVKFFLDSLRYYRVIPDDTSDAIRLIVHQTKVRSRAEEETVIEVTPP